MRGRFLQSEILTGVTPTTAIIDLGWLTMTCAPPVSRRTGTSAHRDVGLAQDVARQIELLALAGLPGPAVEAAPAMHPALTMENRKREHPLMHETRPQAPICRVGPRPRTLSANGEWPKSPNQTVSRWLRPAEIAISIPGDVQTY